MGRETGRNICADCLLREICGLRKAVEPMYPPSCASRRVAVDRGKDLRA